MATMDAESAREWVRLVGSDGVAMAAVIVVMGPGGQGRVVLDALLASGRTVAGVLDDGSDQGEIWGVPVIGRPETWGEHAADGVAFAVAMGDGRRRRALGEAMLAAGATLAAVVHPAATVSARARLGRGVHILAGAAIGPDAVVGDFSIANQNAAVDHDCVLGVAVGLGPGVTLPGGVQIGDGAFVGAGATLLPGVRVGPGAVVGAGAVVTKDVPAGVTVAGNPARVLVK